jgi:hypothetical protein
MDATAGRQPTGTISVIDPLSRAILWSREVLFRPFDPVKWLVLGFCAWLAMLGEGGGPSGSAQGQPSGDHGNLERGLQEAWHWLLDHLIPVLLIVGALVIVAVTIWLLVTWLSSRGKFMFLDGVVNNRAAVVEPWKRLRGPANALFRFRIVLGLVCGAVVIAFLVFVGILVRVGLAAHELEPLLIAIGVAGLIGFVATMIGFAFVGFAMNEFVVPLMYLRSDGVAAAWRELGRLFSSRPGAFVLYVLVKILVCITVTIVCFLVCCLTCCVVLLPYVGKVVLLPVHVFVRAFPLYFLGQFGASYAPLVPQ